MICPKCNTNNIDNAPFCIKCETNLYAHNLPKANSNSADLLIMVFIAYLIISEIARFAIERMFDNWYEGVTKYIIIGINVIAGFSVLLLGLSIKNYTLKVFGILIAAFYALYIVYSNIVWFMN